MRKGAGHEEDAAEGENMSEKKNKVDVIEGIRFRVDYFTYLLLLREKISVAGQIPFFVF